MTVNKVRIAVAVMWAQKSMGLSDKNRALETTSTACHAMLIFKRSLETKVPTIWTDEKHSQEEAEPGRNSDMGKVRREKIRDGESQKREDAGARKGRKVAKDCVFPMFSGSGGSTSTLAKAAGAEPAPQMRGENCTPLWHEAHFHVNMYKTPQCRSTFGS